MTISVYIQRCVCLRWVFLGLLLVLMSCEGGGTGGSGSPVVASGTVTDFGSIVVTGIRFDTSDATVTLNGQRGAEADLRLGQVVTVQGTLDPSGTSGTAATVVFERNAEGPIDSINPATRSLVVLGQLVVVDDATQFGNASFSDLVVGNIVALSGFVDVNGVLRATRIDRTRDAFLPGTEIETRGTIANLDEANQTFSLNRLTVDFSAAQLINLLGNQLRNGQVVEVTSVQNVVAGVLLADRVEAQEVGIPGAAGERAELEGIIFSVTSADIFVVNGQPVRLTPDTVLNMGTTDDLVVGAQLQVEGFFDAAGVLVATEIEFFIDIEGLITRITAADTFEVDGQLVRLTPDTVFEGGTVEDIAVNQRVEVEGFFDAAGVLVAIAISFL